MKTCKKTTILFAVIFVALLALVPISLAKAEEPAQTNESNPNILYVSKYGNLEINGTVITDTKKQALQEKGFELATDMSAGVAYLKLTNYTYAASDGFDAIVLDTNVYVTLTGSNTIAISKDFSGADSKFYFGETLAPITGNLASCFYGLHRKTDGTSYDFSTFNKIVGDGSASLTIDYTGSTNIDNFVGICAEAVNIENANVTIKSPATNKLNLGIVTGNTTSHQGTYVNNSTINIALGSGCGLVAGMTAGQYVQVEGDSDVSISCGACGTLEVQKPSVADIKQALIDQGFSPEFAELVANIVARMTTSVSNSATVGIMSLKATYLHGNITVELGDANLTKATEQPNCYSIAIGSVGKTELYSDANIYAVPGNATAPAGVNSISLGVGSVAGKYFLPYYDSFTTLPADQITILNGNGVATRAKNAVISMPVMALSVEDTTNGANATTSLTGSLIDKAQAKTLFNVKNVVTTGNNQYIEPIYPDEMIVLNMDKLNLYHVFFDANGGQADTTKMVTELDGTLSSLPNATYEAHNFDGWYDAKVGGNKVLAGTAFTQDTTLYAQWFAQAENVEASAATGDTTPWVVVFTCVVLAGSAVVIAGKKKKMMKAEC